MYRLRIHTIPAALLLSLTLVWALGSVPRVHGQSSLNTRFSGYFEHQYNLSRTNERWRQIDYDRLRAELDVRTRQGSRASAGVVYQLYRGDTNINPADYLPSGILQGADSLQLSLDDRHYLNHAYFVLLLSRSLEVSVGKQYLTWGAAWVFNPTELYRPKNSLDPGYDREGIGALSLRLTLGPLSDVLIALVPDGSFEDSGKLVRVRHHVAGFDVSGIAAVKNDFVPGRTASLPEQRFVVGGDVTGELFGLGVWSEATFSQQAGNDWSEITVGSNYTLSDGTLLLAEAFFNGLGKTESPYSAQAWLERVTGTRRSLGRTTVFGMVRRPFGQLWNVGLSAIGNPADGSLVLVPSVGYSFADNVDLLFNGLWYVGEAGDEFGLDQIGGFLRGRLYF